MPTMRDPTALLCIEVALAAFGDLLVQACKLYFAFEALDASDRIAGGTAFRICRADIEHLFSTVFILPTIHLNLLSQSRHTKKKAYNKPYTKQYSCL
jgi:hypothetical protein